MKLGALTFAPVALSPVAITLILILWTGAVYPFSHYGDGWAIWPALAALPAVIAAHALLIARYRPRLGYCLYGAIHALLFVPLWFWSLMLISKDSL